MVDPAVQAAFESVALLERPRLGMLLATGPDFLALLHRLGTGDVVGLEPGAGAATVLLTAKGRIVRRVTAHRRNEGEVVLLTGDGGATAARQHIDRFTVTERAGLGEPASPPAAFALVGPSRGAALAAAGLPRPESLGIAAGEIDGVAVEVVGHDGNGGQGACVIASSESAERVRARLREAIGEAGGAALPADAVDRLRILRGLPAHGHELTEDYNPLEAGLHAAVSFTKGCYIGQEVVARLNTYDKVARVLRGLRLEASAEAVPPAKLEVDTIEVGTLTSRAGEIGLGYLRRQRAEPGGVVSVAGTGGEVEATVVELPFVSPASP